MSQKRARWKGRSLGQTVGDLRTLQNQSTCCVDAEYVVSVVTQALYHIEKLRGKLHRLNLKIQRERK